MDSLAITIARQPFDHMVYHFVLTYSNWESVSVCLSESFEALSDGLQNALHALGGVPRRHRSDSLTAAVNNHSATREFQTRYRDLLTHYGLIGQRINARQRTSARSLCRRGRGVEESARHASDELPQGALPRRYGKPDPHSPQHLLGA
jgi:transposase